MFYPNYLLHRVHICYDDGCKFARNPNRRDVTTMAKKLASVEIVIDKLHMQGHVDKWCLANCDPHLFRALDKVMLHVHKSSEVKLHFISG